MHIRVGSGWDETKFSNLKPFSSSTWSFAAKCRCWIFLCEFNLATFQFTHVYPCFHSLVLFISILSFLCVLSRNQTEILTFSHGREIKRM